jgi:hypothetical protein
MDALTCKGCGGSLRATQDPTTYECEYCASRFQVSPGPDGTTGGLLNQNMGAVEAHTRILALLAERDILKEQINKVPRWLKDPKLPETDARALRYTLDSMRKKLRYPPDKFNMKFWGICLALGLLGLEFSYAALQDSMVWQSNLLLVVSVLIFAAFILDVSFYSKRRKSWEEQATEQAGLLKRYNELTNELYERAENPQHAELRERLEKVQAEIDGFGR